MKKMLSHTDSTLRKLYLRTGAALVASTLVIGTHATASDNTIDLPEEWLEAFEQYEWNVARTFEAEPGVTGILIDNNPGNQIIYLLNESNALIEGPLYTVNGESLSEQHALEQYLGKQLEAAWELLESRDDLWVANGSADADWIIYSFDDMNCPFCARQFQTLKPLVESGKLQVRHLLVGILGQNSLELAEAILNSPNPGDALIAYQNQFGQPGAKETLIASGGDSTSVSAAIIEENMSLGRILGVNSTPSILLPAIGTDSYPRVLQGAQEVENIEYHFSTD